ncbi:DNA primase [Desulfopila sp. IMCC35008]|uniref:DNA primase n=1 Tax=Desulfopila sp. IMCC35008 TaxID=2653858 RepID=UPI0013D07A44|nr:DNA primase [Desulfopila sp. IMCC35008]
MQESWDDIKERVKDRADIVQVIGQTIGLKKSGVRYLGLCPFHGEKTPSFFVDPGRRHFKCFGCGEAGDVFSYVMKYHNLDFPEALKELAGRYGIALPEKQLTPEQKRFEQQKKEMFELNGKVAELYQKLLADGAAGSESAKKYLQKRAIPDEVSKRFGLGYAPSIETHGWDFLTSKLSRNEQENAVALGLTVKKDKGGFYDRFRDRVLFPIYEISGRVCGFGGRIIGDGQPKYMNSPDSPVYNKSRLLLGLYQQKDVIRSKNQAVVVEGNFDLVSLVCHGFENVVAPLGTALTREQLRLLKRYAEDVVLLFDGDAAGVTAAVRSVPLFLAEQMSGRVALLPSGHDPDTFVRENGVEAVLELVERAESLPEFMFKHLVAEYGLTLDGKSRIVEELRPLVQAASSPLQRSVIVAHFSAELGLSAPELDKMLAGNEREKQPEAPPPPPEPQVKVHYSMTPPSPSQKRLISFMILHPDQFPRLEEQGLLGCLAGSIGEVLFFQLREFLTAERVIEPEDLLSVLPEGAEKDLVMQVLLDAATVTEQEAADVEASEETEELVSWMRKKALQKLAKDMLRQIDQAERAGDHEQVTKLIIEKVRVEQEVRSLDE